MITLTKFYQNIWMYIYIANIYNIIILAQYYVLYG